jgi:cytochrome c biogenesis protein
VQRAQTAAGSRWLDVDPLRALWRLLTSVRFALALIGFLALAALLGVLIPQLPQEMRGNPAAEAAWVQFQHGKFGFATDPMYRLGLFQVFRSAWFIAGLGALVASVCVCTANRLPPVWRNAFTPQTRVPDEYFTRETPAVSVMAPDVGRLTAELRRRRYSVRTEVEGGTTYLFADRFPWAQLATFVSHLALILFLAGGFVTVLTAHEQQIFVAEGDAAGAPVFAVDNKDHMQVYVKQAVGVFNPDGSAADYRTFLTVYKDGRQVADGVTTVNGPFKYGGYRFYQSAYFPDGAALRVRDASGRLLYDEVLPLTSQAQTPRVVVRDALGALLLDDAIVPTDFIGDVAGTVVTVPGSKRSFWVGARSANGSGWQLLVFDAAKGVPDASTLVSLREGEKRDFNGMSLSFAGITSLPSTVVNNLPGAEAETVAEMTKGKDGKTVLTVGPIGARALALAPGQSVTQNGLTYEFEGQRAFAGITVRRDVGATFIWVATGTFLLGLALTFYTPRRRLWGKISAGGEAAFRGLGGRGLAIEREVREVARKAQAGASSDLGTTSS